MTDEKKPGMLVEDASAIEVKTGTQESIVRTPDRAKTLEEMKAATAETKPLHD